MPRGYARRSSAKSVPHSRFAHWRWRPTSEKAMEQVLALDAVYPLLPYILEKFPKSVERASWWPCCLLGYTSTEFGEAAVAYFISTIGLFFPGSLLANFTRSFIAPKLWSKLLFKITLTSTSKQHVINDLGQPSDSTSKIHLNVIWALMLFTLIHHKKILYGNVGFWGLKTFLQMVST
jgi:hypothetical protein